MDNSLFLRKIHILEVLMFGKKNKKKVHFIDNNGTFRTEKCLQYFILRSKFSPLVDFLDKKKTVEDLFHI